MCILFIAINKHPDYPTIICANRDEFHQRPTQSMHLWTDKNILAGKDLVAGGTWLGLTPEGKFAALTNHREGYQPNETKKSRGDLVIKALNDTNMPAYLSQHAKAYHGFNLIYGTLNKLNCFNSVTNTYQPLTEGFHSVCNGEIDDTWPKMALGQQQLEALINQQTPLTPAALFLLMKNKQQAEAQYLPKTGISIEKEQLLSSIFIESPDYGTRTTTIILVNKNNRIEVYNRDYSASGGLLNQDFFSI